MTSRCCSSVTNKKIAGNELQQHAFLLFEPRICLFVFRILWSCQVIFTLSLRDPLHHPENTWHTKLQTFILYVFCAEHFRRMQRIKIPLTLQDTTKQEATNGEKVIINATMQGTYSQKFTARGLPKRSCFTAQQQHQRH